MQWGQKVVARGARRLLSGPLYRRAPNLVSYWDDEELVFENYAPGARITAEPLTSEILQFFGRWRSVGALAAHPQQLRVIRLIG